MKKEKKWLVVTSLILTTQFTWSQEIDSTQILKEATVSGTRIETDVMEVPRNVTVITHEDMANSQFNNLGELLNSTAGIFTVGAQQNAGMNQSIFMRGTNSNHTTIMIDGVRISDPSGVNNAVDLSEISLSNIERIEIVRGSHSTLYGSSAIGGVINIITKKSKRDGISGDVNLGLGSFGKNTFTNSQNGYINYQFKNKFYVGGNIYLQSTKGFDATRDTIPETDTVYTKLFDADNFNKSDFNIKAGYNGEKTKGYFSFKKSSQKTDLDKLYSGTSKYYNPWGSHPAIYYDGNYQLDFSRNLLNYGISHQINDKFTVQYYGGYSNMERNSIDDSTELEAGVYDKNYFEGNYDGSILNNDLQFDAQLKHLTITVGANHYLEKMNVNTYTKYYFFGYDSVITSYDSIKPNASIFSGYAQLNLNGELVHEKMKKFNLILGGRFNQHSIAGSAFTFSINPSIAIDENTLFYLNYSTGFNAPSLYQLYAPESNYISNITRGNKNLKAETSQTFELGLKNRFNERLMVNFGIYYNQIENVLEYVYLWDKNIGLDTLGQDWMRDDYRGDTYANVGTLSSYGFDMSVEGWISDKLKINSYLSLVFGKLNYDPAGIDATDTMHVQLYSSGLFLNKTHELNQLIRRPSTANFSLTYYPIKELSLFTSFRFTDSRGDNFYDGANGPYGALSARSVPAYGLIDMGIGYIIKKQFHLNLRMENILDKGYTEIVGYNTRGRSIYFNVRVNF